MPIAEWTSERLQWLRERALHAGFDHAGVAPASSQPPTEDADRFNAWIDAGRAGEMDYLKRRDDHGTLLRSDVQIALPWARSIIVCALNYNASAPRSIDPAPADTGWIARYAWSGRKDPTAQTANTSTAEDPAANIPVTNEHTSDLLPTDYHNELLHRLQTIEADLQQHLPGQTRCYVDTGPLVERTIAARAGIGWIGKNTCVIRQGSGSWLLLGVIVTSIPVASTLQLEPAADRCGSCTRCIDACPTDALIAPRQMDASRCIAYLTIEKKGSVPEDLRAPIGRNVFGCDICQDVCPWNRRAPISVTPGMLPRTQLVNPSLDWLAAIASSSFNQWFRGSPIERTRRKRLLRNIAIAMGNSGLPQFLPQLRQWASSTEDPVLAETAAWALRRIDHHPNLPGHDPDPLLASE